MKLKIIPCNFSFLIMQESCVAGGVEMKASGYYCEKNISKKICVQINNILLSLLIPLINITRYTPEEYH
jgi:hypothetical protein